MIKIERDKLLPVAKVAAAFTGHLVEVGADVGMLWLRATDGDVGARLSTPCEGGTLAAIAVPARTLIKSLEIFDRGTELSLAVEGASLVVSAGRMRRTIAGHADQSSGSAWPGEGRLEVSAISMPTALAREMLDAVEYAACQDDERFYLHAIYLEQEPGRLVAVATDGHRLARAKRPTSDATTSQRVLVHVGSWRQVRGLLDGGSATFRRVQGRCKEGQDVPSEFMELHAPGVRVVAHLKGNAEPDNFPPYKQVIPSEQKKKLLTECPWPRTHAIAALKKLKKLDSDLQPVRVIVYRDVDAALRRGDGSGDLEVRLPGTAAHEATRTERVALNVEYLRQATEAMGADGSLCLYKLEDDVPLTEIRSQTGDVERTQVIMPHRISWDGEAP